MLLDVRRHIHITAERVTPDGTVVAQYDTLGGKSGGETQELIAFIVGSALRYRLGFQLVIGSGAQPHNLHQPDKIAVHLGLGEPRHPPTGRRRRPPRSLRLRRAADASNDGRLTFLRGIASSQFA